MAVEIEPGLIKEPVDKRAVEDALRSGWFARMTDRISQHFAENRIHYILIVLLLLLVLAALWPRMFTSVYPGELGVLYSRFGGGTVTSRVYQEGFHFVAPWDVMTKYNVRVQQETIGITVLSKEALPLKLTISIRYYPEKSILGFLHADVGPDYKNKIVIPDVVSILRMVAGQYSAQALYSTPLPFEQAVNRSLEQVARKYVVLDGVAVKSVELPGALRRAIETKLTEQQLADAYEYKIRRETLEAKRKRIEAEGSRRSNEIVSTSLTPRVLQWRGIEATKELAKSPNSKVIVIGNQSKEMPVILGGE